MTFWQAWLLRWTLLIGAVSFFARDLRCLFVGDLP